jgi:hypothetical protein
MSQHSNPSVHIVVDMSNDDLEFRKTHFSSDSANCVEFSRGLAAVTLRDSKDPDGPILYFTENEWRAFTRGVKTGEFDID